LTPVVDFRRFLLQGLPEHDGSVARCDLGRDTNENEEVVEEALSTLENCPWITVGQGTVRIGSSERTDSNASERLRFI